MSPGMGVLDKEIKIPETSFTLPGSLGVLLQTLRPRPGPAHRQARPAPRTGPSGSSWPRTQPHHNLHRERWSSWLLLRRDPLIVTVARTRNSSIGSHMKIGSGLVATKMKRHHF